MGRKKHAHTTTTTTAATVGPPRTSSGGSSSDELPELPVLGHQRQWDAAKLVLRTASFAAAAAVIGFVVAFNFAGDGGRYVSANVSFGVSLSAAGWDAAEFIVVCTRRRGRGRGIRGIRAAAHVGVDLVLWLAAVATLALQSVYVGYRAGGGGGYYTGSYYHQADYSGPWFAVDVTHLTLLGVLAILHFVLFVRACVEVDRHKKDRRVQELILAMQKQGRNPRDFPLLATFTQQHHHHHQTSAFSSTLVAAAAAATKTTPSASERDFSLKYDHALGPPVPGLLASSSSSAVAAARSVTDARLPADAEFPGEMPVSPEELRNEKVLIGAFPR